MRDDQSQPVPIAEGVRGAIGPLDGQRSIDGGAIPVHSGMGDSLAPPAAAIGSLLLAGSDPAALRVWYERAFNIRADADRFIQFGSVRLLITGREDVAARALEPGRVIMNFHVDNAGALAQHLDRLGVTWLAGLEYREPDGAWFGTVLDLDGNYVQIIELTPVYWARQRRRDGKLGDVSTSLETARG